MNIHLRKFSKYPYPPHYVIKKAFVLTKQYWFVLFVFMVLGYFANYEREYSLCDIMGNYLGCKTTWNSTLWFMLPYVLLLLISKFIFEVINKLKGYAGFLLVFVIWIIAMAALKYEDTSTIEFNAFLKNVLQMLRLLFPFCLGVYAKKYEQIFERIRSNPSLSLLFIFISVLMLLTRLIIWNHFTLPFCCLCFVFLYHCLNVSDIVQRILAFFGEHSLYLWFCHAYFVYYFYRQYAFVARYPILIYSLVISYSLLSAFILSFSYKKTRI